MPSLIRNIKLLKSDIKNNNFKVHYLNLNHLNPLVNIETFFWKCAIKLENSFNITVGVNKTSLAKLRNIKVF